MIIAIASGKGGTGKSTFAVNLAAQLKKEKKIVRLLDCDVEEPNDHLFIKPNFSEEIQVHVPKPVWNEDLCTGCGKCADNCNYNAIAVVKGKVLIFNELCHSCGVCSYVCPENALTEKETRIGKVQITDEKDGFQFAHGYLDVGEALAPNVVKGVKQYIDPNAVNIIDASPGTACPVVEAVSGAGAAVLLTEPTPFGLNDLKLAVGLSLKLKVPTGIVINRSDGEDRIIRDYAQANNIPVIGTIPFNRKYAESYSRGDILVDHFPELVENINAIYQEIIRLSETEPAPAPKEETAIAVPNTQDEITQGNADSHLEITVISGKGGTGKTTVTSCFCQLAEQPVLADNDVDAADLHLLLNPEICEVHNFEGGKKAEIQPEKCTACGKCANLCHFDAIEFNGPANAAFDKTWKINDLACEGCGLCPLVCPVQAITCEPNITGQWFVSQTGFGPMAHAKLGIAEENSGRLVTQVRNRAAELASENKLPGIIADGPPGTGCPVIASISGTDKVIIVTEPTVSGVHDMERVLDLCAHFNIQAMVMINKADLNLDQAKRIEKIAAEKNSEVIAHIPFDRDVHNSLMQGKTVIDYSNGPAAQAIRTAWKELKGKISPL